MAVSAMPLAAQAGAPLPQLVLKPKKDAFTPEMAADRRMPIQEQGRQMIGAEEFTAGFEELAYASSGANDGARAQLKGLRRLLQQMPGRAAGASRLVRG